MKVCLTVRSGAVATARRGSARLVAALCVTLALSACSSSSSPSSSAAPSGTTPSSNSPLDTAHATVATGLASDVETAYLPSIYADSTNPCHGVVANSLLGYVAPGCAAAWLPLNSTSVPGSQILTDLTTPRHAAIALTVAKADGARDAAAFATTLALQDWAASSGDSAVLRALDGVGAASDPLYAALSAAGARASVPSCAAPTSLRVTIVPSTVTTAFAAAGWPQPSSTAVIATYPACAGWKITTASGSTTVLAHDHPISIVTTGHVATVAPFGAVWVTDGWAACGSAALSPACSPSP